jgi:hypothetical protein
VFEGGPAFELRHAEKLNWESAVSKAHELGYSIKVFYHTSAWREYWSEVINEQIRILDGSRYVDGDLDVQYNSSFSSRWTGPEFASMIKDADEVLVNVAGTDEGDLNRVRSFILQSGISASAKAKLTFGFNKTLARDGFSKLTRQQQDALNARADSSEGEVGTMLALKSYCERKMASGEKAFVAYFHNKGACCYPRLSHRVHDMPVATWRDDMGTFVYEFPSICLRALLLGYPICGVQYLVGHYSGNFWRADCGHVAALPRMRQANRYNSWWPEFALHEVTKYDNFLAEAWRRTAWGEHCAYEAFACKDSAGAYINQYNTPCPRQSYLETLRSYSFTKQQVPHKPKSAMNLRPTECSRLWQQGPYSEQKG